jgi:hypothetical protein
MGCDAAGHAESADPAPFPRGVTSLDALLQVFHDNFLQRRALVYLTALFYMPQRDAI